MAHPTRSCAADRRRRAGQYVNTANRRQPPTTSSLHSSSFPSSSSSSSYLNAAKMRLGFEIREGDDLYQFIAATAEERDEWMAEIKTIIRDYMRQQFGTSVGDAATPSSMSTDSLRRRGGGSGGGGGVVGATAEAEAARDKQL